MRFNLTPAIAVLFAIGLSAHAQDMFLRPEISTGSLSGHSLSFYGTNDPLSLHGVGFALEGGKIYGAQDSHVVSLSVGLDNFTSSESATTLFYWNNVLYSSDHDSAKVRAIPVLFNYRYNTGAKGSPMRFYFGFSFGLTVLKRDETLTAVNAVGGAIETVGISDSKYPLNWALPLGVAYRLNNNWSLDAGYRFQETCSSIWRSHLKEKVFYFGVSKKL